MDTTKIHYEEVVESYHQRLHTVLRSFHTGPEFLELWVPDADDVRSLLNMVEAAQTGGLERLSIVMTHATADGLDWTALETRLGAYGELARSDTAEGVELDIRLSGSGPAAPAAKASAPGSRSRKAKQSTADGESSIPEGGAHPLYEAALARAAREASHEGKATAEEGEIALAAEGGGITLSVAVDSKSHAVVRAAHEGATTEAQRGALETLCRIMEGLPLLECADHGVIRAEHALRDPDAGRPVSGVVLAKNASPVFTEAEAMVRTLLSRYREETGFAETDNFWVPPLSTTWSELDEAARVDALKKTIPALCDELEIDPAHVEVVGLRNEVKVCLAFTKPSSNQHRQRVLVDIERALQERVESSLSVELEAKQDLSQIRRL